MHIFGAAVMMRRVDERCCAWQSGEHLLVDVPGCRITHRFRIDTQWFDAMDTALDIACQWALPDSEIERQINESLDLMDEAMSGLERRIIIAHALGKAES